MKQQKGCQSCRHHGVTLGQGFGRIAYSIQAIGDTAYANPRPGHLVDPIRIVRDGTECILRKDVRAGHEHPHRCHSRPEYPASRYIGQGAQVKGKEQRQTDDHTSGQGHLKTDCGADDDIGRRACPGGVNDGPHRWEAIFGIVLGIEYF